MDRDYAYLMSLGVAVVTGVVWVVASSPAVRWCVGDVVEFRLNI
jgi:hypothetical protein